MNSIGLVYILVYIMIYFTDILIASMVLGIIIYMLDKDMSNKAMLNDC